MDDFLRPPPRRKPARKNHLAEKPPTWQPALFIGAADLPGQQYLIDPFTGEERPGAPAQEEPRP